VSDLNRLARTMLERELPLAWVGGEISNFKRYDSGHCYFTLKDDAAQVDCVMFRHKFQFLDWKPENGMQVEVRAVATLYEARGRFQLNCEQMRRAGLGALYEAFERLKVRLEREGMFDPGRKRVLPRYPRVVGVITSAQGAAIRDVLTTLRHRMPGLPVVIYPVPVQGDGAGAQIAQAMAIAAARAECDVLILCRGGGSMEDLWAFNDEVVARAIAACTLPVVTGIGHETDFTIADFAADLRAPTPTAAAQLVCPDASELRQQLAHGQHRLGRSMARILEDRMQRLDYLSKCLVHPGERIAARLAHLGQLALRFAGGWRRQDQGRTWSVEKLGRCLAGAAPALGQYAMRRDELGRRLNDAAGRRMESAGIRLERLAAHLKHLDPHQVLRRGYSIVADAEGKIVTDGAAVAAGDLLQLRFARGRAAARVEHLLGEGEKTKGEKWKA